MVAPCEDKKSQVCMIAGCSTGVVTISVLPFCDHKADHKAVLSDSVAHEVKLLKKYNISYDFLICENGAIIYDNKDNILYSCYLDQDDIDSTIEIIKKYNLKFIIDTGDKYITDLDQKFSNVASIFLDRKTINDVNEMLKIVKKNTNTYSYISPNWINIVNMNVNKKKTLEKLETILENKYKICPIGDAINDKEMISFFDGGVMKNHEKELDSLPNKNHDSLADYIKELI